MKKRKLLSPSDTRGLFGYIAPYPHAVLPGSSVKCIVHYVPPIEQTRCISSAYFDPPYREHLCYVHPEAKIPPSTLTEADFLTVSSTKRFGGRSILKLDSLYGSNAVQYAPGYPKNPSDRRNSNGSGRRHSGDSRYSPQYSSQYDPYRSSNDRSSRNITDFRQTSSSYGRPHQEHGNYSAPDYYNQYPSSYGSYNYNDPYSSRAQYPYDNSSGYSQSHPRSRYPPHHNNNNNNNRNYNRDRQH